MKRFTPFTPKSVYTRSAHFETSAIGVLMQPYEWEFVLALDGVTSAGDVAWSIGLDVAYLEALCEHLHTLGLVSLRQVTLEEYLQQKGSPAAPPATETLMEIDHTPAEQTPAERAPVEHAPAAEAPSTTPEAPPLPEEHPVFDHEPPHGPVYEIPSDEFVPQPREPLPDVFAPLPDEYGESPAAPLGEPAPLSFSLKRTVTGMPIRPLLDFIVQRAGGSSVPKLLQQLAVYRVFRKVPNDLVLAGNLPSLSLTDANFELQNKELYDAIVHAIEETFGVAYSGDSAN